MKKLFFLLCILTAFVACSDNNDNGEPTPPIENLKMPSAETPFTTGQLVTIEGKGFTTTSQIWLRTATKATGDVQTKVTEVTDNSIVFEVPEGVEGKQNVILKQEGKEYKLGEISFKQGIEKMYASLYDWNTENVGIGEININKKEYNLIYQSQGSPNGLIATDKGKFYFISIDYDATYSNLCYFDLPSKQDKVISRNWLNSTENSSGEGVAIGMINNHLHGVKYNNTKGFYVVSINDNGTETEVATFGKVTNFKGADFEEDDIKFDYDPINKIIILTGYNNEYSAICISLNLNTSKFNILTNNTDDSFECLYINNEWYLLITNYDIPSVLSIKKIDPSSLSIKENIKNIDSEFIYTFYWKTQNLIIGFDTDKSAPTLKSLNWNTGEVKELWLQTHIHDLLTIVL